LSQFAVRTRALTREFATSAGVVRALDDLSLQIEFGTIFGFLGPNGAGKTTTVRVLLGLIEATHGDAFVLGHDLRHAGAAVRERSGVLLEHDGLYERLTAYENLEFYARVWRLPAAERRPRCRALLEGFGLWDRRGDAVGTWSRGMKRKLALARALVHRPELIFLDEPTAGLDPGAAAALRDDLAMLSKESHATIFLNTHNLPEAERLCDRVGIIASGRLLAVGTPLELRHQLESQRVEVLGSGFRPEWRTELAALPGLSDICIRDGRIDARLDERTSLAPLVRLLVERGAGIEEVRRDAATLEDVYLKLVTAQGASS
jgi:ABC-2 type transport system ATP-binding protein